MTDTKYLLEIYKPQSKKDVWTYFESWTPFLGFHVGEIIDPGIWEGSQSPKTVLKIAEIQHLLWESEGQLKHKVLLFTREFQPKTEPRARQVRKTKAVRK